MGRFSCLGIPKRAFEESAHRHRRTPAATRHRDLDYDLRTIVRMRGMYCMGMRYMYGTVEYGAHYYSLPLALYCTRSVRDKMKKAEALQNRGGEAWLAQPLNIAL